MSVVASTRALVAAVVIGVVVLLVPAACGPDEPWNSPQDWMVNVR